MKAIVDVDTCTGCGLCEDICPQVFRINEETIADVIADPVPPEFEDTCRDAAEGCPVDAIVVEE